MSYGDRASTLKDVKKTEKELLASTVRSLAEAEDTTDRVLTTLHGQTEQLHRIQADAEQINHNLDQSEWLLRSLKPWGWVRNIFRKDPTAPPPAPVPAAPVAAPEPRGSEGYRDGAARLLAQDAARRAARSSSQVEARDPTEKAYDQRLGPKKVG